MNTKITVRSSFLLIVALSCFGQEIPLRFEHLTTRDGLSQNTVHCILQDHRGFMWFGTGEGLNRFDGYTFQILRHNPASALSLSDNHVSALFEDRNNRLWVGTINGGLNLWHSETNTFSHYRHNPKDNRSLSSDFIYTLFEDSSGGLWTGGDRSLDLLTDTGQFRRHPLGFEQRIIILDVKERNPHLWIATDQGLLTLDPQTGVVTPKLNFRVTSLLIDTDDGFLLGTKGDGLMQYNPETGTLLPYDLPSPTKITKLMPTDDGSLWIGSDGDGLGRITRDRRSIHRFRNHPSKPTSLSSNIITSIYEDRTGTLWVGTWGGGINTWRRDHEQFQTFRHDPNQKNSLSHPWVSAIVEDAKGHLWVGSYGGGLNLSNPERTGFQRFRKEDGLSDDWVYAVFEDRAGDIWIGTRQGLDRKLAGTGEFEHFYPDPDKSGSIHAIRISAIHQDRHNNLWFSSRYGGVSLMRWEDRANPRFESIGLGSEELAGVWITVFDEMKNGDMWLGTYGEGLHILQKKRSFRHDPQQPQSLSSNIVHSVYRDDANTLWIGTDNGLNRLDNPETDHFTKFRQEEGRSQVVYAVLGDNHGHLWCSTNKGLARFDRTTETFQHYDAKDGLQDEYNVGAYYRARDGELFFGGIDGLNAFYPDQIRDNLIPPPVVINGFLLNNKPVSLETPDTPLTRSIEETEALTLNPRQQVFSIEFAALHYQNPARNRYTYKLDGFDKEWIETNASRRIATYTSLDPGHYTFHVRASNKDGIWNEEGASLRLHLKPAPWQSWWAKTLYALVAMAMGYGLWQHVAHRRELHNQRALNERLSEVDQLKDAFLAKTSHELRTPLQGIIGLCESMSAGAVGPLPSPALDNLAMVTASGQRLAGLVDNILDFSKLEHQGPALNHKALALKPLVDVLLAFAQPQVRGDQVQLIHDIAPDTPLVWADEDRLIQIFHNLLGNAVRFTDEGSITVAAEVVDGRVHVSVMDTGVGIAHDDVSSIFEPFSQASVGDNRGGTGLGLAVTKQLVEAHGGQIHVTSQPGKGSCFRFDLAMAPTGQPAVKPKAVLPETQAASPVDIEPQTGAHVLIVDDERINRQVLHNHLSMAGYRTTEVASGREALRLLEQETPDLILLDVMMPDMTGFELCQGLRTRFAPHELPIIFLTAMTQPADLVSGLEVGGNDFLTKPVARDELLARIKVHLDLLDINRTLEDKVAARTIEIKELQQLQARFFTDISHELRTPLTLITGPVADMLEAGEFRREEMTRIQRNGRRLALLVDQLLNISKFELGLMKLQTKEADLSALLQEQVEAFTPWAERAQLNLRIELPDKPVQARFDGDKVQKIVANLLSNAHKHTPAGGLIMLRLVKEPHWLAISVKDTGAGIATEDVATIFDRFQQADDLHEGSGIGLSLARDLAILHGGDLQVTSELGFGSSFTLRLPRTSVLPEAECDARADIDPPELTAWDDPQTELEPTKDEAAKTILIAEDHPELRSWLTTRLSPTYQVRVVADGAEALAHALDHLPDVILSDILMPELNGDELCRKLKNHDLTAHIPVILFTAADDLDQKVAALEHGADAYLPKPFEIRELKATIENLLMQRTRSQETMASRITRRQAVSPPEPELSPTAEERFLTRISDCIEGRLDDPAFGVFELAEEIGLSRRQMLRKLKAIADVSPAEFIRNYRLDRAAQLLRKDPGLNVSEVAYATGFKHPTHFGTLFKERFGKTPSQYP